MSNKPLTLQSPATVVQALMDLVPSGASVTVQLPMGQRQLNVSLGVTQPPAPQQSNGNAPQRIVDMRQDLYPSGAWFQQPAAE